MAASEGRITESHSIEEADARHAFKRDRRRKVRPNASDEATVSPQ
jgi:hypothetical protein